jgi:hypothetical protein
MFLYALITAVIHFYPIICNCRPQLRAPSRLVGQTFLPAGGALCQQTGMSAPPFELMHTATAGCDLRLHVSTIALSSLIPHALPVHGAWVFHFLQELKEQPCRSF